MTGRWGSTENDPDDNGSEEEVDWLALRRRAIKPRVRVPLKTDPIPNKKIRTKSFTNETTGALAIKREIARVVINDPSIPTKKLKLLFPDISIVTLSMLKADIRQRIKSRD